MSEALEVVDKDTPDDVAITIGEKNRRNFGRVTRSRLRNDKDAVSILTGETGIGKSVLACGLCSELDKERFSLERNVLFDPSVQKLREMIYGLPKYSGIVVDELVRVGYRRNWASQTNKMLNELYSLCRYQNQASYWCIPRFSMIDSDLQRRALFWVHVVERGIAVVLRGDKNQFTADPWRIYENEKRLREYFRSMPLHYAKPKDYCLALTGSPNFVGYFTFPDFTPEMKQDYLSLKKPYEMRDETSETRVEREAKDKVKTAEAALAKALVKLAERGANTREMVEASGLTSQKIGLVLKEHGGGSLREVRKAALDLKRKDRAIQLDELPEGDLKVS